MKNGDLLRCIGIYHLVICDIAIENGLVEIVDFPIEKWVDFP